MPSIRVPACLSTAAFKPGELDPFVLWSLWRRSLCTRVTRVRVSAGWRPTALRLECRVRVRVTLGILIIMKVADLRLWGRTCSRSAASCSGSMPATFSERDRKPCPKPSAGRDGARSAFHAPLPLGGCRKARNRTEGSEGLAGSALQLHWSQPQPRRHQPPVTRLMAALAALSLP